MKYEQLNFNPDTAQQVVREIAFLGEQSWAEVQPGKPTPDLPNLLQMWQSGVLILFALKCENDIVRGYQIWQGVTPMFNITDIQCQLASIYVMPEFRQHSVAFLKYSVKTLKSRGNKNLLFRIPKGATAAVAMAKQVGGKKVSSTYRL